MHQPGKDAVPRIVAVTVVMLVIMVVVTSVIGVVPVTAGLARPPHRRKFHEAKDAPMRDAATAWLVSSVIRSALI
jgi:hypothetical protein